MSDFGSAFSWCGRLGIIFVYCWLSGQNWSCCYCCVPKVGSKTTTKSNYYNQTQTSTFPTTTSTALPTTTLTTESAAASKTVSTTDPSSFKLQIQTTANVHLSSGAFSNNSDSQADSMLIIIIPSVALIILLIVGAILIQKKCQTRRKDKETSEVEIDQQQQHTIDYDNLIQSTNSIRLDPEGKCFYENSVMAESPAIESINQSISSPLYATLEFLPNNSIVEDYANTFRSVQFLNGDISTTYAEINFKSSE